jgi:hypothetical protein
VAHLAVLGGGARQGQRLGRGRSPEHLDFEAFTEQPLGCVLRIHQFPGVGQGGLPLLGVEAGHGELEALRGGLQEPLLHLPHNVVDHEDSPFLKDSSSMEGGFRTGMRCDLAPASSVLPGF